MGGGLQALLDTKLQSNLFIGFKQHNINYLEHIDVFDESKNSMVMNFTSHAHYLVLLNLFSFISQYLKYAYTYTIYPIHPIYS